jgi:VWFA-related protein
MSRRGAILSRFLRKGGGFCLCSEYSGFRAEMHLTHMLRASFQFLASLLVVASATAQAPPGFTSQANLVPVPTLVRDPAGAAVYGLHEKDFILEDNGVEQEVHLDEEAQAQPISLVVAVQTGRRASREFGRITGLSSMLDPVLSDPNNEAAVVFFDSKLDLARDFTNDGDLVESDLKAPPSGDEGAAILDAMAYSARLLARRPEGRQRVLLLISETRDHGSMFVKLDNVVRLIGETNTSVYAIPFSPYKSQQLDALRRANPDEWSPIMDIQEKLAVARQAIRKNAPKALASMTGGEYELFSTRKGFETDMIGFANHLNSRYLLSFEPKQPQPGLHQIRVRLRNPGNETVLFRSSYWVGDKDSAP